MLKPQRRNKMRIKSDGVKTTISGIANCADIDLIKWVVSNLSFVNGIKYDIDGQQWIGNIKSVYDENTPQIKVILSLLNSI